MCVCVCLKARRCRVTLHVPASRKRLGSAPRALLVRTFSTMRPQPGQAFQCWASATRSIAASSSLRCARGSVCWHYWQVIPCAVYSTLRDVSNHAVNAERRGEAR